MSAPEAEQMWCENCGWRGEAPDPSSLCPRCEKTYADGSSTLVAAVDDPIKAAQVFPAEGQETLL